MNSKLITILLLICLPIYLAAQTRSTETVKINGQLYYVHTIKEGETVQDLAKIYNVAAVDIEENNPTMLATGKLKSGTRVRIPDLTDISKNYPLSQWDFTYYQVKTQVKLKDIAKEYNIDVKDIKKNNPDIDNKPSLLSKIRIPLKKGSKEALAALGKQATNNKIEESNNPALAFNWDKNKDDKEPEKQETPVKKEEVINVPCDKQDYDPKSKSFIISFLLPLQLNESTRKDYNNYASFLEGALLAIEQMKIEGFSAKINIKDVYDKATLNKAITNKDVEESDLIIGPFSTSSLKSVSEFSKNKNIPLISPYEPKTESLAKDNPYFFQVYPAESSMDKELFQKTVDGKSAHIVLIHSSTPDSVMLKAYQSGLKEAFTTFTDYEHKMGVRPEALASVLKRDVQNLIFVASNDEAFVSDLLDRLITLNTKYYPISLYGTMQWRKNFKMINLTHYYTLNMHIVQPFYIDYTNENVKKFIGTYRQTYNNEPTQYAFQGYDVTYYFLSALKSYGRNFAHCLQHVDVKLLHSKYKFEQAYGTDGGYVNTESYLLEYTPDMNIVKH